MKKGIITEHTLVENFDIKDIHMRDTLEPNTTVDILGYSVFYGISYTKIGYNGNKTGFVDSVCVAEI